jgi:hypothetical protein
MAKTDDRRGVCSLQDALEELFRSSGLRARRRDSSVFEAWGKAASALAGRARAVRFNRGELVVEVDSAAHLHELKSFTGEALRVEANRILESERIRKVVFKPKR